MPDNNTVTIATPYEDLLRKILAEGTHKNDRTGTGTTSLFAQQLRFDLAESFPLITTKQVHFHSVVGELLWFLSGSSNVAWLQENGIRIWNEWADDQGELGPVYGVQWRSWPTPDGGYVDQISASLAMLRADPDSRRNIVSAWNVGEFIWTGGDCHIYDNHREQVALQLTRDPRPYPQLELRKAADLFSYTFSDVVVRGYNPHPRIPARVSV